MRYNPPVYVPVWLDRTFAAPLLLSRKIWYGYSFRRIHLINSNLHAIVDPKDFYELTKFTWSAYKTRGSYHALRLTGNDYSKCHVFMHRQIIQSLNPEPCTLPPNLVVDHINRDGLDNRRANLRLVTKAQNNMNRPAAKGSSKFKGVHYRRNSKLWHVSIGYNYKRIHLGVFDNQIEAAKAYDTAALKYYGEHAYLNFPQKKKQKGLKFVIRSILDARFSACHPEQ
jgi:hypothetical protein